MGGQVLHFDTFKSFDHNDHTAKHCVLLCVQNLLTLMASNFNIKMTWPQNIVLAILMFHSLITLL